MVSSEARWSDLVAHFRADTLQGRAATWGVLLVAGGMAAFAPVQFLLLVLALSLATWVALVPSAVVFLLILCMGNTKANLYLGFFTLFPEYLVILAALVTGILSWMERPRALGEAWFIMLFAALTVAGLLSMVDAREPHLTITRSMIIPIAGMVFWLTASRARNEAVLARGLTWIQWAVALHALLAVTQLVAAYVLRVPFEFAWLRRYGNPAFEYNIGPPVLHEMSSTFRANGLFNDPNILGGYLAATLPLLLAAAARSRTRQQAFFGWGSALLAITALLLSLSRSGFLGATVGVVVFMLCRPTLLRDLRLATFLVSALVAGVGLAAAVGVRALLLVTRLASSFANNDYSARQHESALWFAVQCVLEHPITGIGLNNFGIRYSLAVEPGSSAMMSHNAFLSWFAEAGLLGGSLFLILVGGVVVCLRRGARSIRMSGDSESIVSWLIPALSGCLAAILTSNVFYDYSLRSFVWVICGLAVATARVAMDRRAPA